MRVRINSKPLQRLNQTKTDAVILLEDTEAYELGNSFGVVFDDVKTLALYGELSLDFSKAI